MINGRFTPQESRFIDTPFGVPSRIFVSNGAVITIPDEAGRLLPLCTVQFYQNTVEHFDLEFLCTGDKLLTEKHKEIKVASPPRSDAYRLADTHVFHDTQHGAVFLSLRIERDDTDDARRGGLPELGR